MWSLHVINGNICGSLHPRCASLPCANTHIHTDTRATWCWIFMRADTHTYWIKELWWSPSFTSVAELWKAPSLNSGVSHPLHQELWSPPACISQRGKLDVLHLFAPTQSIKAYQLKWLKSTEGDFSTEGLCEWRRYTLLAMRFLMTVGMV